MAVAGYAYDETGSQATGVFGVGYSSSGNGTTYGVQGLSTGSRTGGINVGGHFSAQGAANNYALITGTGNVGIGTATPSASLQIKAAPNKEVQIGSTAGAFSTSAHFTDLSTLGTVINLSRPSDGAFAHSIFSYTSAGGDANLGIAARSEIKFVVGSVSDRGVIIKESGNVGIGTNNPAQKLAVNGTIKAKEVIVETTGWSDHVFADDYALAPLSEVEEHIKANRHLPGIPSASEVAANGVSVGEMQAKMLAKIEELTLHVIRIEKENSKLRVEVRALRETTAR